MEVIVGRSGKAEDFLAVVTASARTRFALSWFEATGPVANSMSVSPLTREPIDGPPPLYGTWVSLMPVDCFSISIERWLVVPAPLEAALRPPVFFASATSSFADFAGTLGCTTRTSGVEEIQLTGARSLSGSNFTRLPYRVTLTARDAVVNRIV